MLLIKKLIHIIRYGGREFLSLAAAASEAWSLWILRREHRQDGTFNVFGLTEHLMNTGEVVQPHTSEIENKSVYDLCHYKENSIVPSTKPWGTPRDGGEELDTKSPMVMMKTSRGDMRRKLVQWHDKCAHLITEALPRDTMAFSVVHRTEDKNTNTEESPSLEDIKMAIWEQCYMFYCI